MNPAHTKSIHFDKQIERGSEPFNIVKLFFEATAQYPENIAIIEKKKSIKFSELKKQIEITATYFKSKGILKGDRVMIFVPMSIDLYRIVLALFHIGATAVFLDEWVNKKRMEQCCDIAQCKAFIAGRKVRYLSYFSKALRSIPIKLGIKYPMINHSSNDAYLSTHKTDTALITFTTGSTGTPKAAKRTHGFLEEQFNALSEKINPKHDDIDMPVLPIVLLINLGVGCTSVIADFNGRKPESIKEKTIINQIKEHKVNRLIASPFLVKRLSEYAINTNENLESIDKIFTGGAPVFPQEAAIYNQAFPDTEIEIVYGSTEAEPICSINTKECNSTMNLEEGLNVGKPYRKINIKVIKYIDGPIYCQSEEALCTYEKATGDIGEIIVSGPHVLREYVNNKQALIRNKIFIGEECWHRTGDSGYFGKHGNLYLTGRCNTLIYNDQKILSPFIFEHYFQTIDGIEKGTIIKHDNNIVACLELNIKDRKEAIIAQIKKEESRIQKVNIFNKLPRDPRHFSKIEYGLLRKMLVN